MYLRKLNAQIGQSAQDANKVKTIIKKNKLSVKITLRHRRKPLW